MESPASANDGHPYRAFLPVFPQPKHNQPITSAKGWQSYFDQTHSGIWLTAPGPFPSLERFLADARVRAEKRLDMLSVLGAGSHMVPHRNRDVLALIETNGRQEILIRSPHILSMPYGVRAIRIDDPDAEKPKTTLAKHHESMRYFRLAQVSADAFGCFVNLYRALESILDKIHPYEKGQGNEKTWFENAIRIALARCHPHTTASLAEYASSKKFTAFVYEEIRNGLFHAKPSRKPLVPLASEATNRVQSASRLVSLVVVELLKEFLPIGQGECVKSDLEMFEASNVTENLQGLRLVVEGDGPQELVLPIRVEAHRESLGHLAIAGPFTGEQIPNGPIVGAQIMAAEGPGPRVVFDGRIDGRALDSLTVEILMAVDFELGHRTAGWIPEDGVRVAPRLKERGAVE